MEGEGDSTIIQNSPEVEEKRKRIITLVGRESGG